MLGADLEEMVVAVVDEVVVFEWVVDVDVAVFVIGEVVVLVIDVEVADEDGVVIAVFWGGDMDVVVGEVVVLVLGVDVKDIDCVVVTVFWGVDMDVAVVVE